MFLSMSISNSLFASVVVLYAVASGVATWHGGYLAFAVAVVFVFLFSNNEYVVGVRTSKRGNGYQMHT